MRIHFYYINIFLFAFYKGAPRPKEKIHDYSNPALRHVCSYNAALK